MLSAWLSSNCAPDGKRAASLGITLTLSNIGGIVAGQIYQTTAAPAFTLGHAWSLGCLSLAWIGWWILRAIYKRRTEDKLRYAAMTGAQSGDGIEGERFTDRSPEFKYLI